MDSNTESDKKQVKPLIKGLRATGEKQEKSVLHQYFWVSEGVIWVALYGAETLSVFPDIYRMSLPLMWGSCTRRINFWSWTDNMNLELLICGCKHSLSDIIPSNTAKVISFTWCCIDQVISLTWCWKLDICFSSLFGWNVLWNNSWKCDKDRWTFC